ncbi:MAG: hypothetical protein AB7V74_24100 [Acidimicrobiia bacterium]
MLAACGANAAVGELSNDRGAPSSSAATGHDGADSVTSVIVGGHDRAVGVYATELAHGHDELIPCIADALLVRWPDLADRVADASWPAGQEESDVRYLGLGCVFQDRPNIVDQDAARHAVEELRGELQARFQSAGLPADDPTMDCVMLGMFIDAKDFLAALVEGRVPTAAEFEQSRTVFDACDMARPS